MNIKPLIVFLFLLLPSVLVAQVEYKEEKTKVNSIKKNSDYVYGEGIADTEEEALEMAETALRSEIMRVISENESLQDTETILVNAVSRNSSKVQLKRGTMDRIFLYVSKNNILAGNNTISIDRRSSVNNKPVDTNTTEPVIDPLLTEYKPEQINEPVVEEITVTDLPVTEQIEIVETTNEVDVNSPILRNMLSIADAAAMQEYVKEQKEVHKLMWGNVRSEVNPGWYIIVFSGDKVAAILDKGLNRRLNFLTGEKAELSDYSNNKKVWFTIYE